VFRRIYNSQNSRRRCETAGHSVAVRREVILHLGDDCADALRVERNLRDLPCLIARVVAAAHATLWGVKPLFPAVDSQSSRFWFRVRAAGVEESGTHGRSRPDGFGPVPHVLWVPDPRHRLTALVR